MTPSGLRLLPFEEREGYSACVCDEGRDEIITCNGRLITLNVRGKLDSLM